MVKLTDSQWFSFISGMLVGEWFNSSEENMEIQTIFEPICVGGETTIGMKLGSIHYSGEKEITIPLTTHNVNIEYCGFNAILNVPSGLEFLGYSVGDFSSEINIIEEDNQLFIQGFKPNNANIKKESLLCLLKFKIKGIPTTSQHITFQNGDCKDFNSSMLFQYLKGIYWGIFPMKNIDGALLVDSISNKLGQILLPIGEESQQSVIEADSGLYTQSGIISYQNISSEYENYVQDESLLGIIAENLYSRNFWLNLGESQYSSKVIKYIDFDFYLYSEIISYEILYDSMGRSYKYYSETLKEPEWENCEPSLVYEYEEEDLAYNSVPFKLYEGDSYTVEPVKIKHIHIRTEEISGIGTYSLGCFNISYKQHKYIKQDNLPSSSNISEASDLIFGIAKIYYCTGEEEEVILNSKYNAVSSNSYSVFIDSKPIIESERLEYELKKNEFLGYTELEGDIYSDSEQEIEIEVGEIKYKIKLKPGWNNIKFRIPSISYKKRVLVVKIKVKVPNGGYILFPLGFTIRKKKPKGLIEHKPWLNSLIEKVFIKEVFKYISINKEEVDLDGLIEKFIISEFFENLKLEIEYTLLNLFENIDFSEFFVLGSGGVAVDLDALLENIGIFQVFNSHREEIQILRKKLYEELGIREEINENILYSTVEKKKEEENFGVSEFCSFEFE